MKPLLYKLAIKNILHVTCLLAINAVVKAQNIDVKLNLKQVAFTNPEIKEQLRKHEFWHDYMGPIEEFIGSDSTGIYYKRRPNEFYPRTQMIVIDQYDHNYNLTSQIIVQSERNYEIQQVVLLNGKLLAITRRYIYDSEHYRIEAHTIPKEGGMLPNGVLLEEAKLERTDAPMYRRLYTDWSWNEKYIVMQNHTQLLMVYVKTPKPQKNATLVMHIFDKELKSIKRKELDLPANENNNFTPSKLTPLTRAEIKQLQMDTLGKVWMLLQTTTSLNKKKAHNYWEREAHFWKGEYGTAFKNNFLLQYDPLNEQHYLAKLDKPERIIDDCKLLLHPEKNLIYVGGNMLLQKSTIKTEHVMFLHTFQASDVLLLNYTEQALSAATTCAAKYMGNKKKPAYAYKKTFFRIEIERFYKVQYLQLSPDKQHVVMGQEYCVTNVGTEFLTPEVDFVRLFYLDVYCSVFGIDGNSKQLFHIPKVQNCKLDALDRSAMDVFASYVLVTQNKHLYVLYNEVQDNIEKPTRFRKNSGMGEPFLYTISLADGSFTGNWLNMPEQLPDIYISPYFTQMHPNNTWNIYLQEFHFLKKTRPFWGTLETPK